MTTMESREPDRLDPSRGRAADQRRPTALVVTTWLGTAIVTILIWASAGALSQRDDADARQRAGRDTANLALIIAEQTARVVSGVDRLLMCLSFEVGRLRPTVADLQEVMTDALADQEVLVQISYANVAGTLVQTSISPIPPMVNIADREHFRVHKEGTVSGLFISRPVFGRYLLRSRGAVMRLTATAS
ncbi:MAG: hypothetical protein WCO00_17760, partial [Rhodospirillaceae bacterium]